MLISTTDFANQCYTTATQGLTAVMLLTATTQDNTKKEKKSGFKQGKLYNRSLAQVSMI